MNWLQLFGLLIFVCALFWGGREIVRVYAIPPQIVVPVTVVLVLLVLWWLLQVFGMAPNLPRIGTG